MCDVLEEEAALEDDANAVLGPADHKNCSYMTGGTFYSIFCHAEKTSTEIWAVEP